MDLHWLLGKHWCAAVAVFSLLHIELCLTPNLGTSCDWIEDTRCRPQSQAEKSAGAELGFPAYVRQFTALSTAFHFEHSPPETLKTETFRASQVPLCFCVDFQSWTTENDNDSFFKYGNHNCCQNVGSVIEFSLEDFPW